MERDILQIAIEDYIPKMDGWSTPEKCYEMARLIKGCVLRLIVRNAERAHPGKPGAAKPRVLVSFSHGWAQEPEGP